MEALTHNKNPLDHLQNKHEELDLLFSKSMVAFYIMQLDTPIEWDSSKDNKDLAEYAFSNQRITRINPAMLNQFGAAKNEMLGLAMSDIFSRQQLFGKDLLYQLFDKGHSHNIIQAYKLSGEEFWAEVENTVLYNNEGRITGHFTIQFDITDKKTSQDLLLASEQKFKGLFDHATDGIFISDTAGNLLDANPRACKMLGYDKHELVEKRIEDVLDKEHLIKKPLAIDRLVKGEELLIQRVARRKDGSCFDIEVSSIMMGNGNLLAIVRDITSRKNTEKQLLEVQESIKNKNQQLQLEKNLSDNILESLPGVFYLYNLEGKFLRWNRNFSKVTGYSDDEIATMHPLNFFREEEKELLTSKISNVFVVGEDNVEAPFLLKDGSTIPFYFTGISIQYEGETCLMGVGINISERVEAKQKLEKTNSQLKTAQEISKIGYWEWYAQTNEMFWSDEMYQLWALDKDDGPLSDLEIYELIHPDDREKVRNNHLEILKHKGKGETEFRAKMRTGETGHFKVIITPHFNNIGELVQLEGVLQDISDIKEGENRLRVSNERFELISKATNDGIWDWDIKKNQITGNIQFFNMCGIPTNKDLMIDAEKFFFKVHPEDITELERILNGHLKKQTNSFNRDYRYKPNKDGYRYFQDKVHILYSDGKPVRMLGAIQDVTEKINADKKILQTIINTQEKERFEIGRELHDNIMQLLVCAQMHLNLINTESSIPAIKTTYDFIKEGMNEIRKLSHQLAPSNVLEKSLEESVRNLLNTYNLNNKYDIYFKSDIAQNINLDKELTLNIYRIFQEQMNNINKHAKATEIKVEFKLAQNHVNFKVSDNGVGFDQNLTEKGIGLNNIQHRVDALEGTFKVESAPGNGCKICINIPLTH